MKSQQLKKQLLIGLGLVLLVSPAFAANTGTEFKALYDWVYDIARGYAARAISIAAIVIGALLSLGRGSPMPILTGVGFAVFLAYLPGVVNGLLTATI